MTAQERVINLSDRTEGMVDASANYYQESKLFRAIQNTQALEYDRVYEANLDLALQLSPVTATWGLIYWEFANGITPNPTGSYELRRPIVLSRMASDRNFGAPMVHQLAKNFGEEIRVNIDTLASKVTIVFQRGVPTFLEQFIEALEDIIHAHLQAEYKFEYHIHGGLEVETAYRRYVYSVPKAAASRLCGTYPDASTYGRVYNADVAIDTEAAATENAYKKGGTYAAGPFPVVAIDGRIYDTLAVLDTDYHTEEQPYTHTGTADSGTKPSEAVIGRKYEAETSVAAENRNADNSYRRCNQIYSGGEPLP